MTLKGNFLFQELVHVFVSAELEYCTTYQTAISHMELLKCTLPYHFTAFSITCLSLK